MDRNEQTRVEQLVSQIVESDGSSEALKALDALLLDRADLQTYYARCLSMHMLLAGELADSPGIFPPLLDNCSAVVEKSGNSSPRGEVSSRPKSTPASLRRSSDSRWLSGALAAVALSLMVVVLFRGYEYEKNTKHAASNANNPRVSWHYDVDYAFFWTEDTQAANLVSRLTRTSTPSRLLLPSSGDIQQGNPQLVGGTAWMEYAAGSRERGRLIALPPHTTMNVFIDTDASSHNTLSIVELDSTGLPVGANYSVGNVVGEQGHASLRTGWIGEFSQSNPTSSTKYFLFTGAYLDKHTADSPYWAPSDFRVYVDSPELIIAGWDDRSYTIAKETSDMQSSESSAKTQTSADTHPMSTAIEGVESPAKTAVWQDCDYNDIRAIVRFTDLGGRPLVTVPDEYVPEIDNLQPTKVAEELGAGFRVAVQPGEEVYLMVSGYAALQNAVQIVDVENQRVLWRHDGIPLGGPLGGEWTDQFPADRGVYVIRNLSDEVRRYELLASCLYNRRNPEWRTTPYKLLSENAVTSIVGFEDSPHSSVNADWQDILVAIYRFDPDE